MTAHGHWCAFTDLYHTIPYHTMTTSTSTVSAWIPGGRSVRVRLRIGTMSLGRHCGQAYMPHLPRVLHVAGGINMASKWGCVQGMWVQCSCELDCYWWNFLQIHNVGSKTGFFFLDSVVCRGGSRSKKGVWGRKKGMCVCACVYVCLAAVGCWNSELVHVGQLKPNPSPPSSASSPLSAAMVASNRVSACAVADGRKPAV